MSLEQDLKEYQALREAYPELKTLKGEEFYARIRELEKQGIIPPPKKDDKVPPKR